MNSLSERESEDRFPNRGQPWGTRLFLLHLDATNALVLLQQLCRKYTRTIQSPDECTVMITSYTNSVHRRRVKRIGGLTLPAHCHGTQIQRASEIKATIKEVGPRKCEQLPPASSAWPCFQRLPPSIAPMAVVYIERILLIEQRTREGISFTKEAYSYYQ